MCLIAFALGVDPALPLLLAGNRDEWFDRPTDPLHPWPDLPGIWAGRDRRDGGTWLGIAHNGRVAMLTNVRSPNAGSGVRSRGELVTRWLQGTETLDSFATQLAAGAYGGFNLVMGDWRSQQWTWLSNRDPAAPHRDVASPLHRQALGPGFYALSNAALDTPWPKALRLKAALRKAWPLAQQTDHWIEPLQAALADEQTAPPADLPATGVPAGLERALSSPFVRLPERGYGTRSSLIVRVRQEGADHHSADLLEWTHGTDGWNPAAPLRHRIEWRGSGQA